MVLTPLIDMDNLNLSTFWTFVVIDDKGGEIVYKDSEKTTKRERNKDISDRGRNSEKLRIWHRGRDMTKEGDQLKF